MHGVFDAYEGRKRAEVMRETWGHLEPTPGAHPVELMFAHSDFGDLTVIRARYPTLQDSPWLAEVIFDFALELAEKLEPGEVGTWRGRLYWRKNGNHKFREVN